MDNKRIVTTNLPNEKKYREILASVIGQMSDGIWENSSKYNGYWNYAECNSDSVDIIVNTNWYSRNTKAKNPYVTMSDKEIKNFFANKVKQIALIEMQSNYEEEIKEKIYGKYPTKMVKVWILLKYTYQYYPNTQNQTIKRLLKFIKKKERIY